MSRSAEAARLVGMETIIVLGAGYAGTLAAIRLARQTRGRAEVVLVNAAADFVERIRLHELAAGQTPKVRPLAQMLAGTGVRFHAGRASALDPEKRVLTVGGQALRYDRLVYALGSHVDTQRVPGLREHAFTLDPGSAAALARALPAVAARQGRLLVVGGGLTGIEGASELAEQFPSLKVTIACAGALGEGLSKKAVAHLHRAFARLGVTVMEHVEVRALAHESAALASGAALPFDVCLWAGGFVAAPLAREAGLAVNERGQVRVDRTLRSISHPTVYGAGDAAQPEEPTGSPLYMSCQTAMPLGAHAADNLARALGGQPERPFSMRTNGVCISLGRRDGIIQPGRADGSAMGWALTGRLAAWFKERVCRFTTWSLDRERRGARYRWRTLSRPAALETTPTPKRLAA
jgi:NADH:ubiquinone reductase (H+-translocating)